MTLKINGHEVIPGKLWFMRNGKKALIGAVHPDELATTKVIGWLDTVRSVLVWHGCGKNFSIYSFASSRDYDLIRPVLETKTVEVPELMPKKKRKS